jgi:nicotinate phosphoribosyltransferase
MTSRALCTDLYELTMIAGYYTARMTARATFELSVRTLPRNRSFLVAAGLEQALDYLEQLRFTAEDIAFARTLPALTRVPPDFFDTYLAQFRFTGDVWAADEGTPLFPPEPILRVTAPLGEAQLVETALLAIVGFQTSVASRAARVVEAAAGRPVAEFGARRAHGLEAGVLAGRAAFLAGCESTSGVEAGRRFGIPVSGTMAHSWVLAFADETSAFRQFADVFGESVLLLDTYDAVEAARHLIATGLRPRAVRVDSGDIVDISRQVRGILDAGGLRDTSIFVSSDLDERRIAAILAAGAPVDGFGVGAALSTSSDAPSLGAIYKLVEIERDGRAAPIMKHSPEKHTLPGRKQAWRRFADGVAVEDVLDLADAAAPKGGEPLLKRVMTGGRREQPTRSMPDLQARCRGAIAALPASIRQLDAPIPYPVRLGTKLEALVESLARR